MDAVSLLFGALVGGVLSWFFLMSHIGRVTEENKRLTMEKRRLMHEHAELEKCGNGLERFNERQIAMKEAAKGKIVTALRAKGTLKNETIAELVDISSATVVRYMDELEKEGKVVQEGRTGKSVFYRLNTSATR